MVGNLPSVPLFLLQISCLSRAQTVPKQRWLKFSLSQRKLSYDAWKQVVDEGVTPEAAKVKYANTVQMLKRKYGSKVNETERSRCDFNLICLLIAVASLLTNYLDCSGVITGSPRTKNSTTQEAKSSGSREYNSKTLNPDPIPQDTTGNSNLATLTSPQQSSTSPGAPAITSSNQTSITNNVLIPDRKPSAEPTGIYYDGTCYYCVVCELRLETCRCDDSLLL